MKKIVIVGALGYLGTELCKIYSGESWFNKIVALDSRFVSERVNLFKDWNIEKQFYSPSVKIPDSISKWENLTPNNLEILVVDREEPIKEN